MTLLSSSHIDVLNVALNVFKTNPFLANVPILYSLNPPENQGFAVFLGGIKWKHRPEMG